MLGLHFQAPLGDVVSGHLHRSFPPALRAEHYPAVVLRDLRGVSPMGQVLGFRVYANLLNPAQQVLGCLLLVVVGPDVLPDVKLVWQGE